MKTVRCGMAQLYTVGGAREENVSRAVALIGEAAAQSCEVVVLPECCDLGWTDPSATRLAGPVPGGASYESLAAAARRHGISVVAGLVEREDERCYNTVVMIGPQGHLLGKSRKINELEIAHTYYAIGNCLSVALAPFANVGLNVCADNFANALTIGDVLCRMGAQMILSPCSWADDARGKPDYRYHVEFWVNAYARLARHYRICVVGVSNVGVLSEGPWAGREVVGSSVAVGPDGDILALCRTGWDLAAQQLLPVDLPVLPRERMGTGLRGLPLATDDSCRPQPAD